jgi:speckle-type POZ protein
MYSSTAIYDQEITCRIWIKFNEMTTKAPSKSETNALKQFTNLYVRQTNCDVEFQFENGQCVGGHAIILTARSLVLAAMIQQANRQGGQGKIRIHHIRFEIFKDVLHFIYSGKVSSSINQIKAQSLFEAADEFDVGDLKQQCVSYLISHIRMNNVYQLISWAKLHSVDELLEAAVHFHSEKLIKLFPTLSVSACSRITMAMSLVYSHM